MDSRYIKVDKYQQNEKLKKKQKTKKTPIYMALCQVLPGLAMMPHI